MNREDIIRFGEQADEVADRKIKMRGEYHPDWHQIRDEAFAALVAAHELEACALVLDKVIEHLYIYNYDGDASTELRKCAKAIRARGEA